MTFANGGNKIYTSCCVLSWIDCAFKTQTLVWIDGHKFIKVGAFANLVYRNAVDAVHRDNRRGLALLDNLASCHNKIAFAQTILLDFGHGHICIHFAEFAILYTKETISIGIDFKKALTSVVVFNRLIKGAFVILCHLAKGLKRGFVLSFVPITQRHSSEKTASR